MTKVRRVAIHPRKGSGRSLNQGELQPIPDKRAFRQILQSMNSALRDSHGGGILERFDVISKVLFIKVFDEREVKLSIKAIPDFRVANGDTPDAIARRLSSLWRRTCRRFSAFYPNGIPELTQDKPALYRMAKVLDKVSLLKTPGDIKGIAYEELLRNTFDKNENQQYFTPHEIVEFMVQMMSPGLNLRICDPACGTGGFLVEAFKYTKADGMLVGAEVDERLARVAQMNLIMHGAERAMIHRLPATGSLAPLGEIQSALPPARFDLILTNPPFGSDLFDKTALGELETGRGRASRRRSVLFTERCLELLRPGGQLAIVLDDSVLNLAGNADIRRLIRHHATVEAVVSLPDVAFMPYSTAKASILFLRKQSGSEKNSPVFMAEAARVGRRPNGDPLYSDECNERGNRILLSDLPEIVESYRRFRKGESLQNPRCFSTLLQPESDRLDIFYYRPKRYDAEKKLCRSRWPTPSISELLSVRRERINPFKDLGDSAVNWIGLGDIEEGNGEYDIKTVAANRIKSLANVFKGGDILFSRLRPNLRKVVLVLQDHEGGICSGEILVLCPRARVPEARGDELYAERLITDPEYLAFLLRSDLVYGQLMNQVTGVGRPRISQEAILGVRIPLPPLKEQRHMLGLLKKARLRAALARDRARNWMKRSTIIMDEAYEDVLAELTREPKGTNSKLSQCDCL